MTRGSNGSRGRRMMALVAITLLAGPPAALAASSHHAKPVSRTRKTGAQTRKKSTKERTGTPTSSLSSSPELWATVDVCNATGQPDAIGVRGSMPGDGHPEDQMYMRFQVQYLQPATDSWMALSQGGESAWVKLGPASAVRQGGQTFQFVPEPGETSNFTLRGVVSFQWRRGQEVVHSASRVTSAGHKANAGADPEGFSAATCVIP